MHGHGREIVKYLLIGLTFVVIPFLVGHYWTRLLTSVFMFGIVAQATNLLMGFCGLVPFGNVVFFGIGAYVTAIAMGDFGVPFFAALIAAAVACAALAAIIGFPILRLKGHYFAIATMGVSEAVRQLVPNLEFTGGGQGYNVPLIPLSIDASYYFFYFLMFSIMVLATLTAYWISKNRIGYALKAIMYNEEGARSIGINTTIYKVMTWAVSAFIIGITGGVFAYWHGYVDAPGVFDLGFSVKFIIMLLLGGAGTIMGPILGAFIVELLSEIVWSQFLFLHLSILGGIIVAVVIFMPKGFLWFYRQRFSLDALLENVRKGKVR